MGHCRVEVPGPVCRTAEVGRYGTLGSRCHPPLHVQLAYRKKSRK